MWGVLYSKWTTTLQSQNEVWRGSCIHGWKPLVCVCVCVAKMWSANLIIVELLQAFGQGWVTSPVSPQMHCQKRTADVTAAPCEGRHHPHTEWCSSSTWELFMCILRCKSPQAGREVRAMTHLVSTCYSEAQHFHAKLQPLTVSGVDGALKQERVWDKCDFPSSSLLLTGLVLLSVPRVPAPHHLTGVIRVPVEPVLHFSPEVETKENAKLSTPPTESSPSHYSSLYSLPLGDVKVNAKWMRYMQSNAVRPRHTLHFIYLKMCVCRNCIVPCHIIGETDKNAQLLNTSVCGFWPFQCMHRWYWLDSLMLDKELGAD